MALENIPTVCIEMSGKYKFVQIQGPENRNYLYGTSKWMTHAGIFDYDFLKKIKKQEINPEDFRCVGGGKIFVDESQKVLLAFDKSKDYGRFDEAVVKSLLEKYVSENVTSPVH